LTKLPATVRGYNHSVRLALTCLGPEELY
jgi:hypothetical protein